ncbi:MAG: hypothetical protein HPY50_11345 [Firmicutes bacterium]|nr:hypothetical protein [Bacillota bacterium]
MSLSAQSLYSLFDGVLDEGLPFLASYLEKTIRRPILITDNSGLVHYPEVSPDELENRFVPIPTFDKTSEHHYDELNRCLYYKVQYQEIIAYVIVRKLTPKMVPHTLSILSECKLAVKCYFYKVIDKDKRRFELELAEYLFLRSNKDISDIIRLKNSAAYSSYLVAVIEIDNAGNEADWKNVAYYFTEYLKNTTPDILSLAWHHCLILIIPAYSQDKAPDMDKEWPMLGSIRKCAEVIETKFDTVVSLGVGRVYPLADLRKSYNEARIALGLPKLVGHKGCARQFNELGMFSLLFSQDFTTLRNYCIDSLGKLLKYDDAATRELLSTLRLLLYNGVNWKATADDLFIHVNTLYYRISKIEELLNIDFSDMDTRTNLFTAIKVWDILNLIGYAD